MTAWADYVDARLLYVHQLRSEGASVEQIVGRLEVDAETVEAWLRQAPVPFPGSSRAQLDEWKTRVSALEAELHAAALSQRSAPIESEFRALRLNPDPELCGCQYWAHAPGGGKHHPRCMHASEP